MTREAINGQKVPLDYIDVKKDDLHWCLCDVTGGEHKGEKVCVIITLKDQALVTFDSEYIEKTNIYYDFVEYKYLDLNIKDHMEINKQLGLPYMNTNNTVKETNPKDAVGIKKIAFSCVPANVISEIALGLMEGARKYGRHNYRDAGVRFSVYYDAAMRHLTQFWEGEDIDPDSQLNHITKALSCLTVVRDAMMNDNWNDDRPPKLKNQDWVRDANKKAEEIIKKYPNSLPPYQELDNKP